MVSQESHKYDVFLSYHRVDRQFVAVIAARLEDEAQLEPFFDDWHLIAGESWQVALESALERSAAGAIFLGGQGLGPWQGEEMRSMLDEHVAGRGYRLIPVILPGADPGSRHILPRFLRNRNWVDFRRGSHDARAFRELVAAIRGQPPGRPPSDRHTLLTTFETGNSRQRQEASEALGALKDRTVIPIFERSWQEEEDPTVRHWMALAIGDIGGGAAKAALQRLSGGETDLFARLGIDQALQSITCKEA